MNPVTMTKSEIPGFVLKNLETHPKDIVRVAAERFGVSRQAIHYHLDKMIERGLVSAEGQTRAKEYSLVVLADETLVHEITPNLGEDRIWREGIRPKIIGASDNTISVSRYGCTEVLNNAIVHSSGQLVWVKITQTAAHIDYVIGDDGVGIFRKITEDLHLDDERHAIFELSKGKLTTNPAQHSGEGIFFTTRAFDRTGIRAGNLLSLHNASGDWMIGDESRIDGTTVHLKIDVDSPHSMNDVYARYTVEQEDGISRFTRTRVPVFLAQYGDENLVSRSQAKRVLNRLERFREVILDFTDVPAIGQAFADEIFRVFAAENPSVGLRWVKANDAVEQMIYRAIAFREEDQFRLL